jgi:hypothetical protein
MIRLPNLQKAVEAIIISGIAFFLLEHIMGYDKVLYKWFVFCSTASCVGAVAGMVRTVLVGRILLLRTTHYLKVGKVVILPKFASMPVELDFCLAIPSVAISLVIWMSITGWVGMIISFILLMCHALNITDIFAPWQLFPYLRHLDGGEILMGFIALLFAMVSFVVFTIGPWEEAMSITSEMLPCWARGYNADERNAKLRERYQTELDFEAAVIKESPQDKKALKMIENLKSSPTRSPQSAKAKAAVQLLMLQRPKGCGCCAAASAAAAESAAATPTKPGAAAASSATTPAESATPAKPVAISRQTSMVMSATPAAVVGAAAAASMMYTPAADGGGYGKLEEEEEGINADDDNDDIDGDDMDDDNDDFYDDDDDDDDDDEEE